MSIAGRLGGQMNRMRMGGYGTASALPMSDGMAPQGVSLPDAPLPSAAGGMAAKVAPVQLHRVQRPGFAGFAERFVNPDPTTTGGAITLAARYAGAAFGDPMSQGLLQMERDQQLQERQAAQDEVQQLTARAQLDRLTRPQYLQAGRSIVQVDPETGSAVPVYEAPAPEPTSGPLAYLGAMGIDPRSEEGRRLLSGAITNSPEALQGQRDLAGFRASLRPPPGGATMTPYQRTQLQAQAAEAIAKGADPNAVRARLAKMGID